MSEKNYESEHDRVDPVTGDSWASPVPQWRPTGESVESLDANTVGMWMVWTQGSTHVWEIRSDGISWTRLPGAGSGGFVGDAEPQRVTRVERWPSVGGVHFLWFDDPARPLLVEQWRRSSTIRRIESVVRADD